MSDEPKNPQKPRWTLFAGEAIGLRLLDKYIKAPLSPQKRFLSWLVGTLSIFVLILLSVDATTLGLSLAALVIIALCVWILVYFVI